MQLRIIVFSLLLMLGFGWAERVSQVTKTLRRARAKARRLGPPGLALTHFIVGSLLTLIMVTLLGYCLSAQFSKRMDTCGPFSWIGGLVFGALGIKYMNDTHSQIFRKLQTMRPESIKRRLYSQNNMRDLFSAKGMQSLFKTSMEMIKDEDLSKLRVGDSKAIFQFIRNLLLGKFPSAKADILKAIRQVQRLSQYMN